MGEFEPALSYLWRTVAVVVLYLVLRVLHRPGTLSTRGSISLKFSSAHEAPNLDDTTPPLLGVEYDFYFHYEPKEEVEAEDPNP